jgi:hypothetical protein
MLRSFYNGNGGFTMNTVENKLVITNGTSQILHKFDANGNYDITDSSSNTDLISFDGSQNLTSDCALYGHINDQVAPITSTIVDHENRITTIENSSVIDANLTSLQNRVTNLETYITHLKQLILVISKSVSLQKPDNSGNFDYTGLLP